MLPKKSVFRKRLTWVFFKEVELVFTKDRVLARNVKIYPLDSCPGPLRDNTHPDILFSVVSPWSFIGLVTPFLQMLAAAIAENNLSLYKPITPSNTHWLDWPEGGKL